MVVNANFKDVMFKKREKKAADDETLNDILKKNKNKPIIMFYPLLDWNVPLFQRPQHIALNLSREGFLYFYCTPNWRYDNDVNGFIRISDSGYLTNKFKLLYELNKRKIIHLYSSDFLNGPEVIEREIKRDNIILYEYVDEMHEAVAMTKIPENIIAKHKMILEDERCAVIVTADKLYKQVLKSRSKNCALATNGVDYAHFSQKFSFTETPDIIKPLLEKKKPIVGYIGALASWFDYELIIKVAHERPEYEILLIGWPFDESINSYSLDELPNINIIGPIPYKELPKYVVWFDVATIPFKINEITESTSPIKLFEYMAMGHPIVTTGMPECRKYKSVLIGENHDDFVAKLDKALTLKKDQSYKDVLKREALENTWEAKAKTIAELLRANLALDKKSES